MGEASLYLPGACNIPVAGTGCFCADPSPVVAGVIPQYQPLWEGLVSSEGLLPSVASCSNCLTMFSSVGWEDSQATCKGVPSWGHSKAVVMNILKLGKSCRLLACLTYFHTSLLDTLFQTTWLGAFLAVTEAIWCWKRKWNRRAGMVMAHCACLGHPAIAHTVPCCKGDAVPKVLFRYCLASWAGHVEIIQLHAASLPCPPGKSGRMWMR